MKKRAMRCYSFTSACVQKLEEKVRTVVAGHVGGELAHQDGAQRELALEHLHELAPDGGWAHGVRPRGGVLPATGRPSEAAGRARHSGQQQNTLWLANLEALKHNQSKKPTNTTKP